MPVNQSGEKTEKPTPRRLRKARQQGQVAKSQELSSAFTLMGGFLVLFFIIKNIIYSLTNRMSYFLSLEAYNKINDVNSLYILIDSFYFIARLISPVLLASAIIGLVVNFLQVGPLFVPDLIKPDLKKINPISGFKRLFSLKSVVELIKSLFKIAIVAILAYLQLKNSWQTLINLSRQGITEAVAYLGHLIFKVAITIIICLVVLGIADYIYQKWEYIRNLKMTKQEVKEEHKEIEGDPRIKSKRREKQREMTLNRMIKAMEEADVVITNPTHIAVALKYDINSMEAPVVVAKGEGFIAKKIKEKARELKIEIVENKPLARALNATTEIGEEIPVDLYQAVAEVLAFLYKNNKYRPQ
ncbi:flagellar biosynthesis protein FlhB [Halothermothrix orenii]|uniref:Flagellar biosynthetic protein FlhB n=1 Tax=Halothermothrix orenii (strain H 168 / OCM 544 / DSM 9562) TaxID=373903 RepID=B8CYQ0_HALOH|nr:flagellar biosynthesis protein FlhB [Halothermothrix orenii]ACL70419.1 flagellar biosynthetic protein FlhB [Halothermothrix orenii H 168]